MGAVQSIRTVLPAFWHTLKSVIAIITVVVVTPANADAQWGRGGKVPAADNEAVVSSPVLTEAVTVIPAGEPGCPTDRPGKSLVGSWLITFEVGGAAGQMRALGTFTADGNVIFVSQGEASSSPLFTAQHGVWGCIGNRYTFTFLEIDYNPAPDGSFAGIFKLRANINVHSSGDETDQQFAFEFRDPNGKLLYTGTGMGTGKRIKLEPLAP